MALFFFSVQGRLYFHISSSHTSLCSLLARHYAVISTDIANSFSYHLFANNKNIVPSFL